MYYRLGPPFQASLGFESFDRWVVETDKGDVDFPLWFGDCHCSAWSARSRTAGKVGSDNAMGWCNFV